MKKILYAILSVALPFIQIQAQNVGIGTTTPTLAGLVVDKKVGAVNAMFGSNTTGVSIETSYPGFGLNSYYNGGRKYLSNGYAGYIGYNPTSGLIYLSSSTVSGTTGTAATLNDAMTISAAGAVNIQGLDAGYIFKDRTDNSYGGFNWYADGGKASLYRYTVGGNLLTIDDGGNLEIKGNVKIDGGVPGDGKILTSDATGNGSWQASSANTVFEAKAATSTSQTFTPNTSNSVIFDQVIFDRSGNFNPTNSSYTTYPGSTYHFDIAIPIAITTGTGGADIIITLEDIEGDGFAARHFFVPANVTTYVNTSSAFNFYQNFISSRHIIIKLSTNGIVTSIATAYSGNAHFGGYKL